MLHGFDIDGVITEGVKPTEDGVVITGRSYETAAETYKMLRDKGIFNAVFFNPVPFGGTTLENSGRHKAEVIKTLGVSTFFEDDIRQYGIIKANVAGDVTLHLVDQAFLKGENTGITERNEGGAPYQIDDWLQFPYKYFSGMLGNKESTLLDLACGANPQRPILDSHWKTVRSGDYEAEGKDITRMNILDIPRDVKYDGVFSLETIEHVDFRYHDGIVHNLLSIAEEFVLLGTVNLDGPTHLDEHEIWKGGLNPFHVAEYDVKHWVGLFSNYNAEFFQSTYKDGVWNMENELNENGVSIYALIRK